MAEAKKCGFKSWVDCTEDNCKYFSTCTRNPHKNVKAGKNHGRCEVDQNNHRRV